MDATFHRGPAPAWRRQLAAALIALSLAASGPVQARGGRGHFRSGHGRSFGPVFFGGGPAFDDDDGYAWSSGGLPFGSYRALSTADAARIADAGYAKRLATAAPLSSPPLAARPLPAAAPVPADPLPPEPPPPPAEPRTIEIDPADSSPRPLSAPAGETLRDGARAVTVIRRANGITDILPAAPGPTPSPAP